MKKAYWFVFVFLVWCTACSLWYLFGVKGVLTSNQFDAADRFVAIAEILFMLLGACLLGFAIAWLLKEEQVSALEISANQLQSENENLIRSREDAIQQFQQFKSKQNTEVSSLKMKISHLNHDIENLKSKLAQEEEVVQKLKIENGERKWMLDQKKSEEEVFVNQIRELQSVKVSLEQTNSQLKEEIRQLQSIGVERNQGAHQSFVRLATHDHKDDLTKIKGIGPFIEKRLNMLGIYNFQQLSELDPEMVDRVGAAIEFFPGRIERENWIGQARFLSRKS